MIVLGIVLLGVVVLATLLTISGLIKRSRAARGGQ